MVYLRSTSFVGLLAASQASVFNDLVQSNQQLVANVQAQAQAAANTVATGADVTDQSTLENQNPSTLQNQLQQQLEQVAAGTQAATINCSDVPAGYTCPENGGCASTTCDGDFEWEEWVTAHNLYRCMHGVPPLRWSRQIYIKASWETYSVPELHRSKTYHLSPPVGPAGENVAKASFDVSPFQYVSAWYSQVAGCASFPGCPPNPGAKVNSFTTMMWQGAKEIGCFRNNQSVARCWYKGSDTPSCETPNFGTPDVEYKQNVFQKTWSFQYCVEGFKSAGVTVPDVSGVDSITGLVLETPGLTFQDEAGFTGNALLAMVIAGIGFVSMVTVAVVRRRKANVPQMVDEELIQE